jgi:hypothetical protein
MSRLLKKGPTSLLRKKAKRGFRGYPAASIAWYGPTAVLATKVVVGISKGKNLHVDPLRKWFSESDIRENTEIGLQIAAFLKEQGVLSVVMTDRIIGCPHEEGIDYPDGASCPQCPFWAGRDRFTHERIQ